MRNKLFLAISNLLVLLFLSESLFAQEYTLWNRNYDTAPVNEIIELALRKTEDLYGEAKLLKSRPMEQGEALDNLSEGQELDLMSAAAADIHDNRFQTVRFPLLKGLLGHRICLIRKGDQDSFSGIRTAYDFTRRNVSICQGRDWPDTRVLERNGFNLVTSENYAELFELLRTKACDCFLRGAQEISPEQQLYKNEFDIESGLVVFYPQPGLLYVNKNQPELAARIELGLLRALDDGSFDDLFNELLNTKVSRLDLDARYYVTLDNPYLPESIHELEMSSEVWFQP